MSINTVEYANQLLAENTDLKKQVKELTADLDKESEIRHRIHEELNAIKGEQQPVAEIKWNGSELIVQNVSDAFSFGVTEVYTHPAPAVLPPEITFEYVQELGEYCYCSESFAKGANWMRQQVLDMGAKPMPVIDPDTLTEIMQNAWNEWCDDTGCYPDDFEYQNEQLFFDAGRWAMLVAERIIRAAGLEVKS